MAQALTSSSNKGAARKSRTASHWQEKSSTSQSVHNNRQPCDCEASTSLQVLATLVSTLHSLQHANTMFVMSLLLFSCNSW
ncbi:Ras-related protein RABA3 [Zea mays]|uniref:Ras-related protein RABA3 n=1 Tax=Zea mays TaxID=4577 RepID=A0A1D6I9B9_MAIZE|nr:Ras-related protein RABA3 [Zea mays]